jgi:hypothetical protein
MPDDPAGTSIKDDMAPSWLDVMRDLAQLSDQLGRVQKTVAALRELEETSPGAPIQGNDDLERALARIEHKIDGLTGLLSPSNPPPTRPVEQGPELEPSRTAIYALLTELVARVGQPPTEGPRPVAGSSSPGLGEEGDDQAESWGRVILGDDLWFNSEIEADRRRLIEGFLSRDPAVCALAASLLLFQSSPAERIPLLIKDLGEAYYRWQPRVSDPVMPFESALSSWVIKTSESIGVRNRIELVRPGSRFNPQLHKALGRGIEVTQALGWVVLREDGGVFQKASVAVK